MCNIGQLAVSGRGNISALDEALNSNKLQISFMKLCRINNTSNKDVTFFCEFRPDSVKIIIKGQKKVCKILVV